jgi:tape measure domain-containing protein
MASFRDLVVRVGADVSGFKDAFRDATEALEKAGARATQAGGAINRAFENLGVTDASSKVAAQAKSVQASFELLEKAFKDGKITATDYAKAQDAVRSQLENLGKVAAPVVDHARRITEAFKGIGIDKTKFQIDAEVNRLKTSLDALEDEFKSGRVSADDFAKAQKHVNDEITKLTTVAVPVVDHAKKIGEAFKGIGIDKTKFQIDAETSRLKANLDVLEKEFAEGRISADDFAKAQAHVRTSLQQLDGSVPVSTFEKLKSNLGNIGSSMRDLGLGLTASVTAPIVGLATAAIKSASDLQSLEIGLKAVTKEAGPLQGQLTRLQEVAKLPGLGFKEAVQGSINLQAAGFSAQTAERALSAFGNALATVGKGRDDLSGVITALSQIASKGKVSAEEINQLAERLPQVRVAIKAAFGEGLVDAKDFEKAGITSQVFVDKLIREFEKLPKATGGFRNEMENLKDATEQGMAALGRVLLPVAESVVKVLKPMAEFAEQASKQFATLPAPVQLATGAFVALAAAAGPLLGGAGLLAGAANSIITLTQSLAGASGLLASLGSGAGLAGLLGAATPLAIAFGAAIAGWAIYKAVTEIGKLNEQLDKTFELLARGEKATTAQAEEIRVLEAAIAAHNKQVGAQKIVVEATGKEVVQYLQSLRNAVKGLDEFKGASEKSNAVTKDGKINILAAADGYLKLGDSAKKATAGVDASSGSQKQNEEALKKSAAAAERVREANDAMHQRHEAFARDYIAAAKKLNETNVQFEKSLDDLSRTFAKAHDDMRKKSLEPVEITVKLSDRLPQVVQDAIKAQKELDEAFKRTGGTTIAELDRVAKQAEKDYELITASGVASPDAILKAEIAYIRASIEARRAHGETITQEEEDRLKRLEDQLGKHTQKQKSTWEGMMRQVSTIMTDLSKDIADAFLSIFKGNPENDRLKQEASDLRDSLAERASQWEEYQRNATAQLEKIRQKHAEDLAEQESQLAATLAAEQSEYESYVANVNAEIEQIRGDHARELADETADLHLELGRREGEYQDFQREIERQRGELRSSHARQLANELQDLRANLAEKQEAYEDFVEDSHLSLARLQEDFTDDTGDEKRSLDRKTADKRKALKREEEDTERKIQNELKKGKNANQEQIADWRRTLARKREDTEEAIRREEEDYNDFVAERRRRLDQQVQDNKEALERRTRDHKQYLASVTEKEGEIRQKYAERLANEEADLDRSLANRTADLERYRVDVQGKIDDLTAKHAAAQAREIEDLNKGLGAKREAWEKFKTDIAEKLESIRQAARIELEADESDLASDLAAASAEWEKYRSDTAAKLSEIESQFTSMWDRVGGAFQTMLTSMGTAIIRFGTEYLTDKLFKWFREEFLDDILQKIGAKLGDIFGKVVDIFTAGPTSGGGVSIPGRTGTGAPPPTAPTPPPSGGGSGASGRAAQMLNNATGVVSAVADVATAVGVFQLEGTMNAVEENTRYGMIHTLFILGHINEYLPKLKDINDYLVTDFHSGFVELIAATQSMRDMMKGVESSVLGKASQMTVDEDGNPVPLAIAGTGDESLGALVDRFGNELLGTSRAISAQIGQLLDPWTMQIHGMVRELTQLPWRPALDKLASSRPATFILEINSREFARAMVDDITTEQAFRLKVSGQAVY